MILCCSCGIPIEPRLLNRCDRCLSSEIKVPSKVKRTIGVEFCRACERYLCPPKTWESYTWGSRELLLFLVRRNKTLEQLDIIDSNFKYTEPNSRRFILDLTVKISGILQPLEIKYVVKNKQCPTCEKIEAKQFWNSLVQVRHRAGHKRMLMLLEQLILKHGAYEDTTNIKQSKFGIDFYYLDRNAAVKMSKFIQTLLPVRLITSEKLISMDIRSNIANYKFTHSLEIVPLCKDDLVILDESYAKNLNISRLLIVLKVATTITFLDFKYLKTIKLTNDKYWANQSKIKLVASSDRFTKYKVIVKEKTGRYNEDFCHCEMTVTRDDNEFLETTSHLGYNVQEDDNVFGYDLIHMNTTTDLGEDIPDIVLIRKCVDRKIDWKIDVNDENIEEYKLLAEDVENDKEMFNNICSFEDKDELIENMINLKTN